ncbi:uncharacterized protein C2845_PM07G02560 [Panicum miliaceum]|uniref:Transposase MuDR plant domain-containing protein n=1 Tax=Panicum miliaceum TaxID=4540 RepID=A0A3L6SL46_PANMI|nr:uncharacterized protein C2845_PM07G02560 [Panicum miliaceum]
MAGASMGDDWLGGGWSGAGGSGQNGEDSARGGGINHDGMDVNSRAADGESHGTSVGKMVTLVVQFELKPCYERGIFMEEKLLGKLPGSNNASQPEVDVDPAMMFDADIFVGDEQFYSALGFRDEDDAREAPQMEQLSDAEIHEAQILVNDNEDCEGNIVVDKENPKIESNKSFPTMHDFRMALRQHAIKNKFEVHKVVTNRTRYRAECKAKAPSKPKNKTVKPKTVPVVNISPGSITRRRISLLQGGQEYAQGSSTITNPVKRLLVLSHEGGATSSSGIK